MTKPPLRIVSERSEADLERERRDREKERTTEEVGLALRAIAANMLSIVRGGGKPHILHLHLTACLEVFRDYSAIHGCLPSSDTIQEALRYETEEKRHRRSGAAAAEDAILEAAIQIVASKLVGQTQHMKRARSDLFQAIRQLAEVRQRR